MSLVFVQWMEVVRKQQEAGMSAAHVAVPASSKQLRRVPSASTSPGIIDHWKGSTHAAKGVGCVECHQAEKEDVDAFNHYGAHDRHGRHAARLRPLPSRKRDEFAHSHHAKAGNILASLDNFLAETVEGSRVPFNPHSPTPGKDRRRWSTAWPASTPAASSATAAKSPCKRTDGGMITVDDLKPDDQTASRRIVEAVAQDQTRRQRPAALSRQHLAQHGHRPAESRRLAGLLLGLPLAARFLAAPRPPAGELRQVPPRPRSSAEGDLRRIQARRGLTAICKDHMNLDAKKWVLGKDYSQAPTCATCHMSANTRNGGKVTHDPGERISWTNRPPVSLVMDTDAEHKVVTETDPAEAPALIVDSWQRQAAAA